MRGPARDRRAATLRCRVNHGRVGWVGDRDLRALPPEASRCPAGTVARLPARPRPRRATARRGSPLASRAVAQGVRDPAPPRRVARAAAEDGPPRRFAPPLEERRDPAHRPSRGRRPRGADELHERRPRRPGGAHGARRGPPPPPYPPGRPPGVELNNPFYARPTAAKIAAWVAATPPEFRFVVKAQRGAAMRALVATPEESVRWLTEGLGGFGERNSRSE